MFCRYLFKKNGYVDGSVEIECLKKRKKYVFGFQFLRVVASMGKDQIFKNKSEKNIK